MSTPMEQSYGHVPPLTAVPPTGEKKIVTVALQDGTQTNTGFSPASLSANGQWEPGVWKRFPWVGFVAFIVVILCIAATILVLKFSDGKQAANWCGGLIGPNVFLQLFSNVSNLALAIVVANGVAIAWWRRALSSHTVRDLHYSLSFLGSFLQIILKPRYFNLIALAVLGTKIALVDSVLYQKAFSSQVRTTSPKPPTRGTPQSFAADVFPMTATMGQNPLAMGDLLNTFRYTAFLWMQDPLVFQNHLSTLGCEAQICVSGMEAAGFSVECNTSATTVDYGIDAPHAWSLQKSDGYQDLPLFRMNWSYSGPDNLRNYSRIVLNSTFAAPMSANGGIYDQTNTTIAVRGGSCPTNMTTRICELRPALLNYTVVQTNQHSKLQSEGKWKIKDKPLEEIPTIDGDGIEKLGSNLDVFDQLGWNCDFSKDSWCGGFNQSWQQLAGVKVMKYMDVSEPFIPGVNSSLFGFYLAFKTFFSASATASWDGKAWSHYENEPFSFVASLFNDVPEGYCNYTYIDPLTLVLSEINMLSVTVATYPSAYYEENNDANNPVLQAWNESTDKDFDSFARKKNYTAMNVLNATVDLSRPTGGIDPGQATIKDTPMLLTYKDLFYETKWAYVWGAVAATAALVICIIPVYWGFWELGRKVSLDPFEIAHAFQSPVFVSAQTGAGYGEEVLKIVGKNNVQYGEVVDQAGRRFFFHTV